MRSNHRIAAFLSSTVLAVSSLSALPARQVSAENTYNNIVILGDGISSGYALENAESGYYDILADCTGGIVTNYAVSGDTIADLINVLDDTSKQPAVRQADLICISIGSNDLLCPAQTYLERYQADGEDFITTCKRLAKEGDLFYHAGRITALLRDTRNNACENYSNLESKLRALNPDATIVMETLYNPFEMSAAMLDSHNPSASDRTNYSRFLNYVKNTEKSLNDAIRGMSTVKVAEVGAVFEGTGWLYVRSKEHDTHPTAAGHALIAATVMDALEDPFSCIGARRSERSRIYELKKRADPGA